VPRYDVNAAWEDPYEPRGERRQSDRFAFKFKVMISVADPQGDGRIVGPGRVMNVSQSGLCVATKHEVRPGDQVMLALPTKMCPDTVCLPKRFVGSAQVIRVENVKKDVNVVGMRLGDEFADNFEFTVFVDTLQMMACLAASD